MTRSLIISTRTPLSLERLRAFMELLGGSEDEEHDGIYIRLFASGEETATVKVRLDTGVFPAYSPEELEAFRRAIGGPPQSEVEMIMYGSASSRPFSALVAYQVAERMLAAWGGCLHAVGFDPPAEWADKLPHI